MNFKLLQLRYRFLLQLAGFMLYLTAIVCILLYMQNKLSGSRNIELEFQGIKNLAAEVNSTKNAFLLSANGSILLHQSGQDERTLQFQSLINHLIDTLQLIVSDSYLAKNESVIRSNDSVLKCIDDYSVTFNRLLLQLKELGTTNSGKMKAFMNSSQSLTELVSGLKNPELADWALRYNEYKAEFLYTDNKGVAFELETLLDEIVYHPELANADPVVASDISSNSQNCRVQLNELNQLFEQVGSSTNETGTTGLMIHKYNTISGAIDKLLQTVRMTYEQHRLLLILVFGFVIIIITIFYLYFFFTFYTGFKKPLDDSVDYSLNLSKGKNPERALSLEVPHELSVLNGTLTALNKSMIEKRLFVEDLLKQKFKADLTLQGRFDTFGKTLLALKENMRKTREEQTRHAEENQVRRYQNEGIAKFADILRSNSDNLNNLSDVFIKEIVRYLDALQGGLFLLNKQDDDELHLTAAFAYNRKKYLNKSIKLGESLVGTCALERKTINLTNIPDDYVEITSGLGDAPPNNLLLLPIMHEDLLVGVLELASLKKFDSNQVLLGEKIAGSLASTIINARINSQTSELLQKSQQQAAEMAEQEEEMRQNMEELKATQEESARREEELEGIINAIDQSFYVLEYDTEGTILKVNPRLLYLINLHSEKVIGKKHNQLFGKKSKADSLLFANVAEGNTVELVEKVAVNQVHLEIKNTFTPLRSKDGHTIRILNIMNINL